MPSEKESEIVACSSCGGAMDVVELAPFTRVHCPHCGESNRVKTEFGPYRLVRRYAIGGMSVVFLAQDQTLDREVVVKILNEEYGQDERRIGAFEEEARITASISHPHVVKVYTTGRAFGRFFIAMELVGGGHFEHHIKERGAIPEAEVLPLAIQVAEGLKAAQMAGLIHRDVKPGNILLDGAGRAKIVDFGLALVTKGGRVKADEIWATPYYVPPETIEGMEEDFRSDMYAFGATWYHALAGKAPCDEETMDTVKLREAKKRVVSLGKVAPLVSADLVAVVDRAMAYEPAKRYGSYDELLHALRAVQSGVGLGSIEAVGKGGGRRRRPGGSGGVLVGGVAVVVALVFGIWWMVREEPRPVGVSPRGEVLRVEEGEGTSIATGMAAYGRAVDALRVGDYEAARRGYVEVREDPGAVEPTRSWAACEAVVCAYLEGRAGEARREAQRTLEHLKVAVLDEEVRKRLQEAVGVVLGYPVVGAPESGEVLTGTNLMASLLAGLKNWEHGMRRAAMPHLEKVMEVEATGANTWVKPYQGVFAGYREDFEVLEKEELKELPGTVEGCEGLLAKFRGLYGGVKTKGRARYDMRVWQLELEKRVRRLRGESPEEAVEVSGGQGGEEVAAGDRFPEALEAATAGDFVKAVEVLKQSKADQRREGLLLLVQAASSFVDELVEVLEGRGELPILVKRDGGELAAWEPGKGGVMVAGVAVPWREISTEKLLELYRAADGDGGSELERLRREEQAVAYELLLGDRDRAREAAEVLAERSPSFRKRWEPVWAALE